MRIGNLVLGFDRPLVVIAGPCVLESTDLALEVATRLAAMCREAGVGLVFKGSFDKANRTSLRGFRGPGEDEGLRLLQRVRTEVGVPVTTDVHLPDQAASAAEVVDLLQIPAFLCRQTDLLVAAGATGLPVNVKKGQFIGPDATPHIAHKVIEAGAAGVMITERGTTFGHGDLVVDMRGLVQIHEAGLPVCFDCTHSVQRPGAAGDHSGGDRRFAVPLARAAVAIGVDAIFAEVHPDPARALSDAATQLPLDGFRAVLDDLVRVRQAAQWAANP